MNNSIAIRNCAVILIIFAIIGCASIWFMLTPIEIHYESMGQEYIYLPSILTAEGIDLRIKVWKETPNYTELLGIFALFAFLGAIQTYRVMYLLKNPENDALQSKSRRV